MSNPTQSGQFQEILDAAKERRGDLPIDTMIVASHLSTDAYVYATSWC